MLIGDHSIYKYTYTKYTLIYSRVGAERRLGGAVRHRLDGYLAQCVPSPPGKHTFKNFTTYTHRKAGRAEYS